MRREAWPIVGPFVVAALVELAPQGRPQAESYAWALTGLACWGLKRGLIIDAEVLLHPDTVELYSTGKHLSVKSQNTARSILRRIGPRLTKKAPWQPTPKALKPLGIAPPYSNTDLAMLRTDAARQSSEARRRASRSILCLGAGVGLDGRWCMDVRGTHVIQLDELVVVDVGPPHPRRVAVLAEFEDELLELAAIAGEDFLVGGEARSKNKASRALARYDTGPGRPRLSASRARSTWLLHHLVIGTRLPELARAAGFKNVSSLDDLLPYVPLMDDDERLLMLRGSSCQR
jgi:hypothetical protein